ncbi:hypothetical protein [Adlercreutzia shanghongiae]|uniref:ABC transporter permease n=1 Tax=Adlercreutzia shanghongiae TaxID=3111773 RepID=A0ABU6J1C0_9ACTN|nr:hypothetical protein [Adlercreutzia sp. R22]MEC4295893.1 hypothetical protein [Adlercreutzia sp. R22]
MADRERSDSGHDERDVRGTILLAFSAGLYWSWWDSFHEICRFLAYVAPSNLYRPFLEVGGGYLQCLMKPLGIMAGCLLVLLLVRRGQKHPCNEVVVQVGERRLSRRRFLALVVLLAQMVTWAAFCLAIEAGMWFVSGVLFGVASALVVPVIVSIVLTLHTLSRGAIVRAFVGALCSYGVFSNLVYPLFLQHAPVLATFVLYLGVLVAAFVLYAIASRCYGTGRAEGTTQALPPWQLVVHLVVYGCVFGVLHILEGLTETGPLQHQRRGVFRLHHCDTHFSPHVY